MNVRELSNEELWEEFERVNNLYLTITNYKSVFDLTGQSQYRELLVRLEELAIEVIRRVKLKQFNLPGDLNF